MNANKKVEQILNAYGNALLSNHVNYFNVDEKEQENASRSMSASRLNRRYRVPSFRRLAIICAALIILFIFSISICSALGINLLHYSFFSNDKQTLIHNLNEETGTNFYKPEYIVEGYKLFDIIDISDTNRCYVYESATNSYLIIERLDNEGVFTIDNSNNSIETEIYKEYEIKMIKSTDSTYMIALLQKDHTRIAIQGHLNEEQIHSIISSLALDKTNP